MHEIKISLPEYTAYVRDSGTGLYSQGPRTGEGTSLELAKAATVALAVARHYGADVTDFFVAGHTHEELPQGAVSIAWEGDVYDWPYEWSQTASAKAVAAEYAFHFEAINGCILAAYPED